MQEDAWLERVETCTWLRRGWRGFHLASQAGGTNLPMTGPPPPPPLPPGVKAPCLKHVGNMFEASPNWDIADTELDPSLFGKPIEDSRFSVSDFDVGVFNVCGCDLLLNMFLQVREREFVEHRDDLPRVDSHSFQALGQSPAVSRTPSVGPSAVWHPSCTGQKTSHRPYRQSTGPI